MLKGRYRLMIVDLRKNDRTQQWWTSTAACLVLLFFLAIPASTNAAGAISQGFQTSNTGIAAGTLLSFSSPQGAVEPATSKNVADLVGVASPQSLNRAVWIG